MIPLTFDQLPKVSTRSFSPELTPSVGRGDPGQILEISGEILGISGQILGIKSPIANAAPSPATPNRNQRKSHTGGGGGGGVNTGGGAGGGGAGGGGGVN